MFLFISKLFLTRQNEKCQQFLIQSQNISKMVQYTDDIANSNRGQFLIGIRKLRSWKRGSSKEEGHINKKEVIISKETDVTMVGTAKRMCVAKKMNSRRANSQRRLVPAMGMVTANKQTLREEKMGGASVLITKGTQWSAHPFRPPWGPRCPPCPPLGPCGDHDAHPAHHANPAHAHARDLCRT